MNCVLGGDGGGNTGIGLGINCVLGGGGGGGNTGIGLGMNCVLGGGGGGRCTIGLGICSW